MSGASDHTSGDQANKDSIIASLKLVSGYNFCFVFYYNAGPNKELGLEYCTESLSKGFRVHFLMLFFKTCDIKSYDKSS